MIHRPQLIRAYDKESDTFNFLPSFELIKKYLLDTNLMTGNLETTLSGRDEGIRLKNSAYFKGYQGYPCFNSPEILANNLKQVGFDLLTTANNHSMDGWTGGLMNTINVLDKAGLDHVGTYNNKEQQRFIIKNINNINLAFFSYAYATNGIVPPKGKEYLVNSLDMYDKDKLNQTYDAIKKLRKTNDKIDLIVVFIHFGNEYQLYPNEIQKNIVNSLFNAGADIILGSHPHVLQPLKIKTITNSDGTKRKGVVIYSLGNFISSQKYLINDPIPKDAGVIISFDIEKVKEKTKIIQIKLLPTWVQWTQNSIRVVPVDEALSDYKYNNKYSLTQNDYKRLKQVQQFTINHLISNQNNEFQKKDEYYCISLQNLY